MENEVSKTLLEKATEFGKTAFDLFLENFSKAANHEYLGYWVASSLVILILGVGGYFFYTFKRK